MTYLLSKNKMPAWLQRSASYAIKIRSIRLRNYFLVNKNFAENCVGRRCRVFERRISKETFNELLIWSICHLIHFRLGVSRSDVVELVVFVERMLTRKPTSQVLCLSVDMSCLSTLGIVLSKIELYGRLCAQLYNPTYLESRLNFKFH